MPWAVGADVVVQSLGGKRGTVVDVAQDGRYRIRVGSVTMWCREDQLTEPPLPSQAARRARATRDTSRAAAKDRASIASPAPRLDLHGLTVDDAMARVVAAIDRALQDGAGRLEVIHGKGSGRIRTALYRLLRSLPVVASFKEDDRNAGVTWVRF